MKFTYFKEEITLSSIANIKVSTVQIIFLRLKLFKKITTIFPHNSYQFC